jgi:hypothetical protein
VFIRSIDNGGSCGDPAGTVDESNLVIDDGDEWMRFVVDSDGCPSDDDGSGPIPDLVSASGSDSSDAGIGHDTGVRCLRLRGGGPPLAAGPDDNNHLVDAEFGVEAWQLNGGVWYDVNSCGPQSNVRDVLTYPADDVLLAMLALSAVCVFDLLSALPYAG